MRGVGFLIGANRRQFDGVDLRVLLRRVGEVAGEQQDGEQREQPSRINMLRQSSVSSSRPTASGAVSSEPTWVLSRPIPSANPRSLRGAQWAMVLFISA